MPTDREIVGEMRLDARIARAVALLKAHEPPEGYYLAFSGGKDSCVIKELAKLAGVKFEAWYNNTTIDPPELVRFIKHEHPDVRWNQPKHGNMIHYVSIAPKPAPNRMMRWCCSEYKEGGGNGRIKIFGVRAAESKPRQKWNEVAEDSTGNKVICPIVYWSDEHVWGFIHGLSVSYCPLYDEGFTRLGCVDCPLAANSRREVERKRWPKTAEAWRKAVIANWVKWKDVPNTKTGNPRFQAKFESGEAYYQWWATGKSGEDVMRECQSGLLWTNEASVDDD